MISERSLTRKRVLGGIISIFLLLSIPEMGLAQHGHDAGKGTRSQSIKEDPKATQGEKRYSQTMTVQGLKVTLELMRMDEHMKHAKGGQGHSGHSSSHMLMLTLQDTASKEILSDSQVTYTIVSPAGKEQTGKMDWSGDNYGSGFDPKDKGTYHIRLKVEGGGMEREAKFDIQIP